MDIYTPTPYEITVQLSNTGREAKQYYMSKCPDRSMRNKWAQNILDYGATDFDKKFYPNDAAEKEHYKTDYYMSHYLHMHILQNLGALKYCFKNKIPRSSLFVDFGCGPMTAGLALADILSEETSDHKIQTSYFGIDASRNMVAKAKSINAEYNLFAPEHFEIVQDTGFDSRKIPQSFSEVQTAVLLLSFVLAPNTYKSGDVRKLANKWSTYIQNLSGCKETIIIYLNPNHNNFHGNWHLFKKTMLAENSEEQFVYASKGGPLPVDGVLNPMYCSIVRGKLK